MRKTSLSVLLTHSRPVPGTGAYSGSPVSRISSPGWSVTKTFGTAAAAIGLPGRLARTSLPVVVGGQLLEAVGQRAGRRPRPLDVGGLQPAGVVAQVERVGRPVLEQIPVRVDRVLEVVLLDRAPDRLAVEIDDHGGRLAEEDRRRIGLHALDVLRDDLALVEVGQHPIERDHAFVVGNGRVDRRRHLARPAPSARSGSWLPRSSAAGG